MNDMRKDELIETLINLKKKDFVESSEASKNVLWSAMDMLDEFMEQATEAHGL